MIRLALELLSRFFGRRPQLVPETVLAVMNIAGAEVGNGEVGRNNDGPHVRKYTGGKRALWCAYFVSWCIRQVNPKFPPFGNAKRLFAYLCKHGTKLSSPEHGAVFCLHRGQGNTTKGHTGFVESFREGDEFYETIEGNLGPFPAPVCRRRRRLDSPKLLGFVRLPE